VSGKNVLDVPVFTNLRNAQRHFVRITYTKFQQNQTISVGNLRAETRLHTQLDFFMFCWPCISV